MYSFMSFKILFWLENLEIGFVSIYLFLLCFFVAIQDVAIDGIVCDILNEEDYDKGASMQNLGQIFGMFAGANVFLLLSSDEFCQSKFGASGAVVG